MNHTTESSDRVSIWSVDRDDLNFFSYVFPSAILVNCLYYAVVLVDWVKTGLVRRIRAVHVGRGTARYVGGSLGTDDRSRKEGFYGLV